MQLRQPNEAFHTPTSSGKYREEWLGGKTGPSIACIAQFTIENEVCGGETTGNTLFKQSREREMDQTLCGAGDRSGNKSSSRYEVRDD
jgi:hypothetical protein